MNKILIREFRRIDKAGRLVIPREIMSRLGIRQGTPLRMDLVGRSLALQDARTARAPAGSQGTHFLTADALARVHIPISFQRASRLAGNVSVALDSDGCIIVAAKTPACALCALPGPLFPVEGTGAYLCAACEERLVRHLRARERL